MYSSIGKILIGLGILLVVIGFVLLALDKVGIMGRLPGDNHVQKQNFEFHFPVATCIIISVVLTLFFTLFFKWFRK
jgi:quinol-cytochrome oxidoreductase complex cytochrome b subunit